MNWNAVEVSSAWLCASTAAVLAMLLTDSSVVTVLGTAVLVADVTQLVYSLVQAYERDRDDTPRID